MRKFIPNLLTISNLICGCIALFMCFDGKLLFSSYLITMACIFDFFDGASARWLNVSNEIGKQLDSMADLVSFGLVPGAIVFELLEKSYLNSISFLALSLPIFSAYRLAKFNTKNSQSEYFIGLPTPAMSLFFCSLPLIFHFEHKSFISKLILMPEIILGCSLMMSFALIMEQKLISFKFQNLKYSENRFRFNFIFLSAVIIILLHFSAIPLIIILYIIGSKLFCKNNTINNLLS